MKLTGARWQSFVKKPDPAVAGVLLFGTEPGMVHARGGEMAEAWLAGNDDPMALDRFAADELSGKGGRLIEAACQPTLLGGDRVVRVTGAADGLAGPIGEALDSPSRIARLVIEAGNLPPRSKLRQAFEKRDDCAAVGCYPLNERELRSHIAARLQEREVRAEPDAVEAIAQRLSDNLGQIDQELDKLALLAGSGELLTAELVALGLGDAAEATVDALTQAVASGDLAGCERALTKLFDASQSPVGLLRVMLRHLTRLHQARCALDRGEPADKAVAGLAPPVFPRQKPDFVRQINRLERSDLETMMGLMLEAERACKTSGMPDMAVAGQSFLAAARLSARKAGRRTAGFTHAD